MSKKPTPIPREVAARVLFEADRTCCVCRARSKPVQIHHLDDNPDNHSIANLAVLCLDCHRDTQITGGFDRKLDAEQVVLYRDDWARLVSRERSRETAEEKARTAARENDLTQAMALAEIYREAHAYVELAIHYNVLGNADLRDKYIELALQQDDTDDEELVFLRGLQHRPELVPSETRDRYLGRLAEEGNWSGRARALLAFGRPVDAAGDYVLCVHEGLRARRYFEAGFFLQELIQAGLVASLFEEALRAARQDGDLWWQVRSLQELGRKDALAKLVLENAARIDAMELEGDLAAGMLKELLARARGNLDEVARARIQTATAFAALRQFGRTAKAGPRTVFPARKMPD